MIDFSYSTGTILYTHFTTVHQFYFDRRMDYLKILSRDEIENLCVTPKLSCRWYRIRKLIFSCFGTERVDEHRMFVNLFQQNYIQTFFFLSDIFMVDQKEKNLSRCLLWKLEDILYYIVNMTKVKQSS